MSRFIILHGGECTCSAHWIIDAAGGRSAALPEGQTARFRDAIEVRVAGAFTALEAADPRMDALKVLLTEIRRRFPDIQFGGHRQVRGSQTNCPGADFPLAQITAWWNGPMTAASDRFFDDLVAGAYGMRP